MNNMHKFKQTEIGMIPEEWEIAELKDVLQEKGYIRGPFGSALKRPELKSEGIPVYEQEHAIYNSRKFRYFIDNEKFKSLSRFAVRENDLIISCSGTFGKVSIISRSDPKGIISQALLILRTNTNKINPQYLKYFFTTKQGYEAIASRSLGSVQVNIANRKIIEKIEIPLPTLHEQENIVKILSSLDNKIELNQRMNKTLEAIGQAIFKHWFVDFEFPDEEGKPYKSAGGEMVFNEELRKEIPKGWEVGRVADLVSIKTGFAFKSSSFDDSGIYGLVTIKNVMDGFFVAKCTDRISIVPSEMPEYCLLKSGDIIMSLTGNVGRVCFVYGNNYLLNQRVAKLSPNNSNNNAFIYFLFRQPTLKDNLINISKGTAQQNLSPIEAKELNLIIPPSSILDVFSSYMNPIFDFMIQNEINCKTLSQIRDALLPKLMSGKIRVPLEEKE